MADRATGLSSLAAAAGVHMSQPTTTETTDRMVIEPGSPNASSQQLHLDSPPPSKPDQKDPPKRFLPLASKDALVNTPTTPPPSQSSSRKANARGVYTPNRRKPSILINLTESPLRKMPPWKAHLKEAPKLKAELDTDIPAWLSDSLPLSEKEQATLQQIRTVEAFLKKCFTDCPPMLPEMVEFLAHSITPDILEPIYHPEYVMANQVMTALPLILFSNIIYSKALLCNIAGRTFAQPKNTRHTGFKSIKLWGKQMPIEQNRSYQYWVAHLKGNLVNQFLGEQNVTERGNFTKFETALVTFFKQTI